MKALLVATMLGAVAFAQCGAERTAVKTLRDADIELVQRHKNTTVGSLAHTIAPPQTAIRESYSHRLTKEEMTFFTVRAKMVGFKKEADQDFHIVLKDLETSDTMIVEIPAPQCMAKDYRDMDRTLRNEFENRFGKATSKFKKLKKPVDVTVVGVGFFDIKHGTPQIGVAKNGIELHPVIAMVWEQADERF